MPEQIVDKTALRKTAVETLGLLVERYPNIPMGRIMAEASQNFDPYITTDVELARGLNQLFVTYTQFEGRGDQAMKKLLCKLFGHKPHHSYVIVNTWRTSTPIPGWGVYHTICTRCSCEVQRWFLL
jgi:hypothetical protein